jgi:hypothetical protein
MTEQLDWATATWGEIGRDILQLMKGKEDDETHLKMLAEKAVAMVQGRESEEKQQVSLNQINRAIAKTYPRLESEAPNYWHDHKGREKLHKWRHNIFKYLTLGRGIKTVPEPESQPIQTESAKPEEPKQILSNMNIQQLDLDSQTQETLESALNQSGMSLEDFIKQAIKVYAKTITGRNKAASDDLSAVPTGELLTDSKYNTHPGRAGELTKRTIRAIHIYNTEVATEPADRWMITASAIASLIGSRQSTIKEIMPQYQTSIDDNNLNPEWNLNPYSNRKPGKKIDEIIRLTELVPDGIS